MTATSAEKRERTERRRPPLWFVGLLIVSLLLLGMLAIGLRNQAAGQVDKGPAPDFTLQTFDGETITLSDWRGTPIVINFWASWCLECYEEAPLLEQTWRDHRDDVLFLGVAYNDTEPAARQYLDRFDITYPNGFDYGNRISDAYRLQGVPETFFVDRRGRLLGLKVGPLTQAELDQWIVAIRE